MAARNRGTARHVLTKLTGLGKQTVHEVDRNRNPSVVIPVRTLSNVSFSKRRSIIELGRQKQKRFFCTVAMARKFMQTHLVAAELKELIESGKTTSIRDLYYMMKHTIGDSKQNTFEEQEESDPIIEDLEVTIDSLREELNLFASNRGSIAGELTIVDGGDTVDLRRVGTAGHAIPSIVEPDVIEFRRCDARFVLLVEKDAVWRRLNEDKFWRKHRCILLHGQGMAPRGVRRLLYRMVNELELPLYVLVDNDPWGFYIYSVVKQGSINLAYESIRMAVPQARFLGLSSFDQEAWELPANVTMKLKDQDERRAREMLAYPWFQKKEWQQEIQEMLRRGVKLEIEALSRKGISFISEEYIPRKIRDQDFLV
ncbi:MAG: DNA topoisomerase IV subunit A [Planctomycetota bacterium]